MTLLYTSYKKKDLKIDRYRGNTIKKTKFFKVVNTREIKPLRLIYKEENIKKSIEDL